jgi:hypothetical protein
MSPAARELPVALTRADAAARVRAVKRHPALQPLSDDHHGALVLARQVRRAGESGDPDAVARAWQEATRLFALALEPHFAVEEERLFPPLDAAGEGALVARARAEHARLRELAAGPADAPRAVAFGALLQGHVRFEERALFPRAERVLAPAVLEAAGRAALAARGPGAR